MRLTAHPRLFASETDLQRLRRKPQMPAMLAAHRALVSNARKFARHSALTWMRGKQDPSGLGIAREMIDRMITLATAWRKTGDERFRVAALEYVQELDAIKTGPFLAANSMQGFWLSDGEECAGVAIVYDWLFDSLSKGERKMLVDICRRRLFALAMARCRKGGEWWFGLRYSNWNAVCAGGLGMLCLAMYDDCAAARKILPRVEESLDAFVRPLKDTEGGWPEGLGYWNYGMAHAFQYMMSWERCMGKTHPLMRLSATRKTLSFPLDFFPNSLPAGFGDNNGYAPTPFQYAAAVRFKQKLVMGAIDSYLTETSQALGGLMGGSATFCVQHPGTVTSEIKTESRVAKIYKGLGWGMIADGMPKPGLYLSMRGGDTTAEHSHVDLLSFRVLVGKEWLIENGRSGEYLHPTFFSKHRAKINDINATHKNTIFINGVGPIPGTSTDSEQVVRGQGCYGLRMVASSAMAVRHCFCGRLVLMVDDSAFVIIDRVETRFISRVESRMHSYKNVTFGKTRAIIKGEKERLRVTYASLEEAGLFSASTAPSTPTDPSATMLRWCPLKLHKEAVLVTLLTPGRMKASAAVERDGGGFVVRLTTEGKEHTVSVRPSLTLV